MASLDVEKPSYSDWAYWSQIVIDRLTTVIFVFNKPPHADVFMAEHARQFKISQTADLLRRMHTLLDEHELAATDPGVSQENTVAALQACVQQVLARLPELSAEMQYLLKSPWYENCNGRLANILFRGEDDRLAEGLGSGNPSNGRLPETLQTMLEREQTGSDRAPSTVRPLEVASARSGPMDHRPRRKNTFLGSAGRVD